MNFGKKARRYGLAKGHPYKNSGNLDSRMAESKLGDTGDQGLRTGKMAGVCISNGLVLLFAAWLGGAQQKLAQAPADGEGPTVASNAPAQGAKPVSPTPKVTAMADPTKDKGWPWEFEKEHAVLALNQPQIDEWLEQLKLKGRVCVFLRDFQRSGR